ncbi:MAG: hypothetical protein JWM80_1514 [Cyanobacteria bacterium RYN_339]|nr:hypothetical protein [Cyanobacteria bacterium RYN_339]
MMPVGARPGGALFPVLILVGILFMISTMLPQILVQASGAIRIDHKRDAVSDTLDSAIAFAEAKLKRDLALQVASGAAAAGPKTAAPAAGWAIRPSFDNPDYGHKNLYDFEVKCTKISLWKVEIQGLNEVYRFAYVLDVGAWDQKHALNKHAEVTGLATITASPGKGQRNIEEVKLEAMNREKSQPYVAAVKS